MPPVASHVSRYRGYRCVAFSQMRASSDARGPPIRDEVREYIFSPNRPRERIFLTFPSCEYPCSLKRGIVKSFSFHRLRFALMFSLEFEVMTSFLVLARSTIIIEHNCLGRQGGERARVNDRAACGTHSATGNDGRPAKRDEH